jgi:Ser/Thr protein kinase RdoA (MazF antagonist)
MLTFIEAPEIQELIKAFFSSKRFSWKSLDQGLLNQNLVVESQAEKYLLKIYRSEITDEELRDMHQVMEFVEKQGIPVPKLLNFQQMIGGQRAGLYTFLPGKNPSRFSSPLPRIVNMGDMLGRVHATLEDYRKQFHRQLAMNEPVLPTKEKKLEKIAKLIDKTKQDRPPHEEELVRILTNHIDQISSRDWDMHAFDALPRHLCHGDFHTRNLLCQGSVITGVLDWEKFGWGGHAYEVIRSIVYNCCRTPGSFNWQAVQTYIRAYKQHQTLTPLECQLAFPFVFQKLIFGTWMEEEYLKGRPEVWEKVTRRAAMNAYLFKHEQRIAERIQALLTE